VLEVLPHDPAAFTQGLQFDRGRLYESRGIRGESAITEIDRETGAVLRSALVADTYFAEGLAIVGERAIQLTWQAGLAFVYDLATFEILDTFRYEGEGWGLCFDGRQLVMSDGSATLTYRDRTTFAPLRTVTVTYAGVPVTRLNELECVGTQVLANVWKTDSIVVISDTGAVTDVIDASGLLDGIDATGADVLNGVAYDPATGTFLITGKYWPVMFDVVFEPAP
jgi:glutaminyl-peptide cyclotransferase